MFNRVKQLVRGIRIAVDFPRYESIARGAHLDEAGRRFSTEFLESSRTVRLAFCLSSAASQFDGPISETSERIRILSSAVDEAGQRLRCFQRNYSRELRDAHSELASLRSERRAISAELSSAHDALAAAKRDLDAWYSRAEGSFLGNGGKKLPRRSVFGQDLADRDRLKAERDEAGRKVHTLHESRNAVDQRISAIREQIVRIKIDRQAMFALREEGMDSRLLEGIVRTGNVQLAEYCAAQQQLASARDDYIEKCKVHSGVLRLDSEIEQLVAERVEFIRSFDAQEAKAARKAQHREFWLRERGG